MDVNAVTREYQDAPINSLFSFWIICSFWVVHVEYVAVIEKKNDQHMSDQCSISWCTNGYNWGIRWICTKVMTATCSSNRNVTLREPLSEGVWSYPEQKLKVSWSKWVQICSNLVFLGLNLSLFFPIQFHIVLRHSRMSVQS